MLVLYQEEEMKRSRWIKLTASMALVMAGATSAMAFAQVADFVRAVEAAQVNRMTPVAQTAQANQATQTAQNAPQNNAPSPMVKPPDSASGSGGSNNPDNMPVKRPTQPTNDRMMHAPPASGANAK
jgi:hypothetical protein